MDNRIKLAKAMGWTNFAKRDGVSDGGRCRQIMGKSPSRLSGEYSTDAGNFDLLPDPESDANDDYAVLEWMRSLEKTNIHSNYKIYIDFACMLSPGPAYKIGDYARAALKVID
jgi:hypothetical protein